MSFVDQREPARDARSMVAAIAINGAVLAAVLLAPAAVREVSKFKSIEAIDVKPLDPPPPPPEPKPEIAATDPAPPAPPLFAPKPIVETPLPSLDGPETSSDPQPNPLPAPGFTPGGTGTIIAPRIEPTPTPTPAPPVLRDAVRDPRYAANFQPPYPSRLLRLDVEGTATVRVLIGPDGHVSKVEVVSATDPEFGRATERQALSKWRFKPATRDGTPVPSWQTLTVRFTIDD